MWLNARWISFLWYECKQGGTQFLVIVHLLVISPLRSSPLGDMDLLVKCSLGNLILLVNVCPNLSPRLTLKVNLEFVSITIMLKGITLKHNIVFKLYFVSLRNVYNLGPLDVPTTCKHARFARESEATSYGSKIFDLKCSAPPWANAIVKLICQRDSPSCLSQLWEKVHNF